jgi:hypothetical protein
MEDSEKKLEKTGVELPERPFLLTVISLFSIVFFGLISILFLLAFLNSGWINDLMNKYTPENRDSQIKMIAFLLAGFTLHALSFTGSIMLWMMKRRGYIIFAISGLIIASYQLFQTKISFISTSVYIVLIILFGLFYKKLR